MLIQTKYFGQVDIEEEKIIVFPRGIMGFENYTSYTILYDIEETEEFSISWLQSTEEASLAIPVVNPLYIRQDYNPLVEDEVLKDLGEIKENNLVILLTMTVPSDVTKTSVNLKAPFIINADTRKGCQIIADNPDYEIKYNVYEHVKRIKRQKGES
ncbi:flagellar assembly factor FliW [Anaerocolumna jejuensis DSM 15929]|uniref:Flagellar assembly factor FliW n=1 Tax=Anaerocolumna jejuensis DSM 15929 TaxID=1121322 RepID=A0A1M7B5L6_9FIRM|nr:flagellar assembly protein FliW [Anaerocolumna jejuensis]SHL50308.1 flagellar assembly factor FliW [Anaerocolumna jejuensis DSM 15929]